MWSSIKSILKDNTTKCVIVEDGEPKYVVLSFEAYQQLQKSESSDIVRENLQKVRSPQPISFSHVAPDLAGRALEEVGEDEINGEIQEMTDEEEDEVVLPAVRLEDLPF